MISGPKDAKAFADLASCGCTFGKSGDFELISGMKSTLPRPIALRRTLSWMTAICACILLLQSCTQWTEEQKKRQSLPDFKFEGLQGGVLQRGDLPAEQPVTILYFDPDCSHCQTTVESIVAELDGFAGNTLVMISSADRSQVIPYLGDKGLLDRKGVVVGLCTPQQFLDTFGTTQTPTTLFYASDWDLKMAYKGAVDRPGILKGLEVINN